MKYLIIQESDGSEFPVFCVAPLTHAQLAAAFRPDDRRRVVAAGFVEFLASGAALVFGRSESLQLGPRPKDAALITALTMATVRMGRDAEFSDDRARRPRELSPELRDQIQREVARLHPHRLAALNC
jgi:hypothetical protein